MLEKTLNEQVNALRKELKATVTRAGEGTLLDPVILYIKEQECHSAFITSAKLYAYFVSPCFIKGEIYTSKGFECTLQTQPGEWREKYKLMQEALRLYANVGEKGIEKLIEAKQIWKIDKPGDEFSESHTQKITDSRELQMMTNMLKGPTPSDE